MMHVSSEPNRPAVQQSVVVLGSQTRGFFIQPHVAIASDFLKVTNLLLFQTREKETR